MIELFGLTKALGSLARSQEFSGPDQRTVIRAGSTCRTRTLAVEVEGTELDEGFPCYNRKPCYSFHKIGTCPTPRAPKGVG